MKKTKLHPNNPIIPNRFIQSLKNPSEVDKDFMCTCAYKIAELIINICVDRADKKFYIQEEDGTRIVYNVVQLHEAILNKTVMLAGLKFTLSKKRSQDASTPHTVIEIIRKLPVVERVQYLMFLCLHEPAALFYGEKSIFDPWDSEFLGEQEKLSELQINIYTQILACHDLMGELMVSNVFLLWLRQQDVYENYYNHALTSLNKSKTTVINDQDLRLLVSFLIVLYPDDISQLVKWLDKKSHIYTKLLDYLFKQFELNDDLMTLYCKVIHGLVMYGDKVVADVVGRLEDDFDFATSYMAYICDNETLGFTKALDILDRFNKISLDMEFWPDIFWATVQTYCEGEEAAEYISARDNLFENIFNNKSDYDAGVHFINSIKKIPAEDVLNFLMKKEINKNRMSSYTMIIHELKCKLEKEIIAPNQKEIDDLKEIELNICAAFFENDFSFANINLAFNYQFSIAAIVHTIVDDRRQNQMYIIEALSDAFLLKFHQYWQQQKGKVDNGLQLKMLHLVADRFSDKNRKKNTPAGLFQELVFNQENEPLFQYARMHLNDVADLLVRIDLLQQKVLEPSRISEVELNIKGSISKDLIVVLINGGFSIDALVNIKVFNHPELKVVLFKQTGFKDKYFKYIETLFQNKSDVHLQLPIHEQLCKQYMSELLQTIVRNIKSLTQVVRLKWFDLYTIQNAVVSNNQIDIFSRVLKSISLEDLYMLRDKNASQLASGDPKKTNKLALWQTHLIAHIEGRQTLDANREKIVLKVLVKGYERAKSRCEDMKYKRAIMAHSVAITVNTLLTAYPNIKTEHLAKIKDIVTDMIELDRAYNEKNKFHELYHYERLAKKINLKG